MESEHSLVELKAHRICDTGSMSRVGRNGLERHRVEFLRNALIVEDVPCGDVPITVFSLIGCQRHNGG